MSDLTNLFLKLKELMKKYEPPFIPKTETNSGYDLWIKKEVTVASRKYPEFFFGGVTLRPKYVSLYNMPMYMSKEITQGLSPALKKKLSGKSCFHFTEMNDDLLKEIEILFEKGFAYFAENGWV